MQSVYEPIQKTQPQSLLQLFETIPSDQKISSEVLEEFTQNSEIYTQLVNRYGILFVTLSALPLQFLIELRQNSSMYIRFHRAGVSLEALSRLALELRKELQQEGYIRLLEEGVINLEKILDLEPEIRIELAQNGETYVGICVEYGYPLFENLLALKVPILKELRQILSAPRIINESSNTHELSDNYQLEAQNAADLAALIVHIAKGDNVSDISEAGSMSLLIAAKHNTPQITKLLIARGADVNYRQINSITPTPLHIAINQGSARLARLLLTFGADLTLRNNFDQNSIEYAWNNNQLLLAYALETSTEQAWQAAIAEELKREHKKNLIIFAMEHQHKKNPDYPYMRFFDRHELKHNIARAIHIGEITNEEEVLQHMNARKNPPVARKRENQSQELNSDTFTLNRATPIVKTAAVILGVEEKEEMLKKAASFIHHNKYSFNLYSVFRSFCTKEDVTKILSWYKRLPENEAIAKIFYFRNYPSQAFTLETLVRILQSPDCQLNAVELFEHNLSAGETKLLSQALKDNQTVTHLAVNRAGMDAESIAYLAEILPNCKIAYLNVGDNRLYARGAHHLAKVLARSSIEHLKIYSNNIGIKGIKYISQALTERCLKSLNLFGNNLSDDGIAHLAAALKKLGKDNQLNDLSIGDNQISSKGILCISKSYSKTNLPLKIDFSYNNLKKQMLFLANLPSSLVLLNVKNMGMDAEILFFLLRDIKEFKNLRVLDVSGNSIYDKKLATLIGKLPRTITSLSLKNTGVAEESTTALASLMSRARIASLNLANNFLDDKAMLALIQNNQSSSKLEVFIISNNTLTDKVIPLLQHWLEPCKTNVFFQFVNNSFTKTGESKLSENNELATTEWTFGEQQLHAEGVRQLAITLPLNQQLISLNFCKNKIVASEIKILAEIMPQTNICNLTLEQNDMDSKTIAPLLQQLSNTQIRYLNLSHNKLGDDSVKQIYDVLMQQGTQLQEIHLANNSLTANSGRYLALIILYRNLLHLDLHSNQIGARVAKDIGDVLHQSSLTCLDLSENKLSDEGAKNISVNLAHCHHLQRLYLNENDINDDGLQNFSRGLLGNKSLTDIQLSKNKIGDEGIIALMKVLPTTNIIKVLLSGNMYTEKVFNNISEAICQDKFKEKNLLVDDDYYSVIINNKKRNLNYTSLYRGMTVSSKPLLIFLAAPSCSGKGIFWKLLKNEGLVDDSMKIETQSYSELEGYNKHLARGIRHPELEPDLYELHNKKRIMLLAERFKNRQITFVEVHLNNNEVEQISSLAEMAKRNGYWTAIAGLSIQPYRLFQNARVSSRKAVISSREIFTELKNFSRFFDDLTSFDYKFLIDFNAEVVKSEKPFLISLKALGQEELIFHKAAWESAQTNAVLDIQELVTQYDRGNELPGKEKHVETQMNLPSPLNILSELSNNNLDFLNNLFRYLVPNKKLLECIDDFRRIQVHSNFNELNSNSPMIFVIRHAESEANVLEKKEQTVTMSDQNIGLTKKGYLQAIILAEYMSYIFKIRNRKINVYYSPTHRTVETMNILLSKIGNYQGKITREECLRERSAGLFHGLSSNGRKELYPTQSSFFEYLKKRNKFEATMPGGESALDISLRLKNFVMHCNYSLEEKSGEDIVIVTHARTSMVLRKMLCGDDDMQKWYDEQTEEPSNASVFVITAMPKQIELSEKNLKEVCRKFFDCDTNNTVVNNSLRFVSSCLGHLTQSIQYAAVKSQVSIENKFNEVLQNFLQLNFPIIKSESEERPYSLLPNILFSAIQFMEEIIKNNFYSNIEPLYFQDLELFNIQLFEMIHKKEISAFSQNDVLSEILALSLFHQRKASDYEDLIFFANYFASVLEGETQEIRNHAQISRKGLDKMGNEYSIDEQFSHAEEWIYFMLRKNKGNLFTKITQTLISSNLEKNDTITIVYPIGEEGSSKNVLAIVYAEILKKELSILIGVTEDFYKKQISIITLPIIQKTKTKRSNLNPFEKAIYRSYYNVSKIQGKILLVDDDVTTGSSMSEMISACRVNGNHIIGYTVAAIIPGCEVLKIHLAVKEALEQALREGYQVRNPHFGPDDPVEIYSNILKSVGLRDGIDSLTNMMGIFQVAALYEPAKAEQVVEYIWNVSTQEISGQSYQDICKLFKRDAKLFPILAEIQNERLFTNKILEDLFRVTNPLKQIRKGWDKQRDCPRKFMLKFPVEAKGESLHAKDVKMDFLPSKKIDFFGLGLSDSVFSSPSLGKVVGFPTNSAKRFLRGASRRAKFYSSKHTADAQEIISLEKAKQESLLLTLQQGKTGPRFIKGWSIQDVEDQGNCFYHAIVEQMKTMNHPFLASIPIGTLPHDSLRLHIQRENFQDREWADIQEILQIVREFNIVIAIVDTRHSDLGFRCYYPTSNRSEVVDTNNPAQVPEKMPIIRLAYTGDHYLSVQAHPSLSEGAIRRGFTDRLLSLINSSTNSTFWSSQMTKLYEKHHKKSSCVIL